MKRALLLSIGISLIAGHAAALSCLRPDAARTFQQLAAAEERYVVLLGSFDFVAPPQQPVSNDAQPQQVMAVFDGESLGTDGFTPTSTLEVRMQTSCAGPWCGSFPTPGADVLTFVEQTDAGYVLTLGACGGFMFDPAKAPIIEACIRGESCEESDLLR